MTEGDGDGLLDRKQRRVYQRDLYQVNYSLTVRVPSDELEHGDILEVTVTNVNTEGEEDTDERTSTGN